MAKQADKYFVTDPWLIIEEGFNREYGKEAESIFSLGNEYMGMRGYFEEKYSGDALIGSYFNGIYERKEQEGVSYKGVVNATEYMVNALDWLHTRIFAGEEELDLGVGSFRDFKRTLDMKSGELCRSFLWKLSTGKELRIEMRRLVSMEHIQFGVQKISVTSLDYEGDMKLVMGLDFTNPHEMTGENMWNCTNYVAEDGKLGITGKTKQTGFYVSSMAKISTGKEEAVFVCEKASENIAAGSYTFHLRPLEERVFEKVVCNLTYACEMESSYEESMKDKTFSSLYEGNRKWWEKVWEKSDIIIEGDEDNQQGIRFCIFQMYQTYNGAVEGTNIGAKGLTGEAYNGNAFWDTEVYCLPFYLFHDEKAARNLLYFRYATLKEAKERAKDLDCIGAFYPIATISGRECCNLWQHASLQLQPSTAVAYGIWLYDKLTGDKTFMEEYGLEMLIEISRMLATRGDFTEDGTKYGYYGVMGPDEFQMMVNHNYYTNAMGQFTFRFTLEVLKKMKEERPEAFGKVAEKTNWQEKEGEVWQEMADKMYIPVDEKTGIFEQHQGYFELPHVDVDKIPMEEFPLYHNWSYDRIYRNDMIKQPDVLMLLLLFNGSYSQEQLKANYEYYEPRCIHESSLSPSVHSILAAQLGKKEEAYDFFRFATRMDLDNYNRNSKEGLHTTSIAASWMNIVYGFGGMRSDGEILSFSPMIPEGFKKYSFRVNYMGTILELCVGRDKICCRTISGGKIKVMIYGRLYELSETAIELEMLGGGIYGG